jgi:hypothetical protein
MERKDSYYPKKLESNKVGSNSKPESIDHQHIRTKCNWKHNNKSNNKGSVTLYGLVIYIKKYYKAKDELWKFKYFTMQKYNVQKQSSKHNILFCLGSRRGQQSVWTLLKMHSNLV